VADDHLADPRPVFEMFERFAHPWRTGEERAARLRALLPVSSLAAFGVARPIALGYVDWPAIDPAALERIKRAYDEQIDQIG
jgi:hypothetical protein